jgi:hypothetical protein
MKICYDTLENIRLAPNGDFVGKGGYYIEEEFCSVCGEPYLMKKTTPTSFCSNSCSKKGKNNPMYKEYKIEVQKKKKKPLVYSLGLPSYDTYCSRLETTDEVRLFIDMEGRRLLQVKCSQCGKWFTPSLYAVQDRIKAVNGLCAGECRLYCSSTCKKECGVYYKKYTDYLDIGSINSEDKFYTTKELSFWSKEVLKRANYKCEYCGEKAEHAHHIKPKKLEPFEALDPDSGIACCKNCHYKYGHAGECSTVNLAKIRCK